MGCGASLGSDDGRRRLNSNKYKRFATSGMKSIARLPGNHLDDSHSPAMNNSNTDFGEESVATPGSSARTPILGILHIFAPPQGLIPERRPCKPATWAKRFVHRNDDTHGEVTAAADPSSSSGSSSDSTPLSASNLIDLEQQGTISEGQDDMLVFFDDSGGHQTEEPSPMSRSRRIHSTVAFATFSNGINNDVHQFQPQIDRLYSRRKLDRRVKRRISKWIDEVIGLMIAEKRIKAPAASKLEDENEAVDLSETTTNDDIDSYSTRSPEAPLISTPRGGEGPPPILLPSTSVPLWMRGKRDDKKHQTIAALPQMSSLLPPPRLRLNSGIERDSPISAGKFPVRTKNNPKYVSREQTEKYCCTTYIVTGIPVSLFTANLISAAPKHTLRLTQ